MGPNKVNFIPLYLIACHMLIALVIGQDGFSNIEGEIKDKTTVCSMKQIFNVLFHVDRRHFVFATGVKIYDVLV